MSISNHVDNDIVIYGGGMAGALLAKALSKQFKITLVDSNEYFEIPMAAPRNLVQPDFANNAIIAFKDALPDIHHIRGTLVELRKESGLVRLENGKYESIKARITVLATGSTFSNALMRAVGSTSVDERKAFYHQYHERLTHSQRILIVGGGPVGVEVAGEILDQYSRKEITILHAGSRLLAASSKAAGEYAARFLKERGVRLILNERLAGYVHDNDVFAMGGEVSTDRGSIISYDLLIWCIGGKPNTGYMQSHLSSSLNKDGRIRVTPELRVTELENVFALGDITDLNENKMAWHINGHVKIAQHNIKILLAQRDGKSKLKTYTPQTNNPKMAVTLGSHHGVVHLPCLGIMTWPVFTRMAKSGHMLVPQYRKILGI